MALRVEEITARIRQEIEAFEAPVEAVGVGYILEVGDGIARVSGLADVMANELLEFPGGVMGIALNLEADNVGVVIMGDYTNMEEGDMVRSTGRIASVPVGDGLIGRDCFGAHYHVAPRGSYSQLANRGVVEAGLTPMERGTCCA